jgi:DUF1365 family protein
MNKWLYQGTVIHHRVFPKRHSLKYRVFFVSFPLSQISILNRAIFSVDRWNILSFFSKDHGDRKGGNLWNWAIQTLHSAGITCPISEIELQTFPRILGFVFNPVSFWYCFDGKTHVATIAEVNNTFGESHSYVVPASQLRQHKVLHVSPFFKVTGDYEFAFTLSLEERSADIKYFNDQRQLFFGRISGQSVEWNNKNLFWTWMRHPLMTFAVVFYIHLHAFILLLKGVPFFGKNGTVKNNSLI